MKFELPVALVLIGIVLPVSPAGSQPQPLDAAIQEVGSVAADNWLAGLVGRWKGTCRTWFEPGKLADKSAVEGEFMPVLNGRFVRHVYVGSMLGEPRRGEELIAFNGVVKGFELAWVDDFHMNYAIMFSQGPPTADGFTVQGGYDVGEGQPRWGWRTEYRLVDADHLIITAYNIMPDGPSAKAVEVSYERIR